MNAPGLHAILIADDEAAVCLIAARVLQTKGYPVTSVKSGQEVLDLLAAPGQQFGLVLLDLSMPKPSGTELIEAIREKWPDLPIVLMSGFGEQSAMARAKGATAFLQKPFRGPDLVEKVSKFAPSPGS